jgi:SRSO17 transposase
VEETLVPGDDGSTWESRFTAYVDRVADALGHADRKAPFRSYCLGLMQPGRRKNVEAIAARVEPRRVRSAHQSLHHFVANADWSDALLLRRVRDLVLPKVLEGGGARIWFVVETCYSKKGAHSVGVARQYCAPLGRHDNCRIAVSLSIAGERMSLPVAFTLYLPKEWAIDDARRAKAGVPRGVAFRTRPQIALEQIRSARAEGAPEAVIQAEASFGDDAGFRAALTELGLAYVVGVKASLRLWRSQAAALPAKDAGDEAGSSDALLRDPQDEPIAAEQLATTLPEEVKQYVVWRKNEGPPSGSRFAAVRVRVLQRASGAPQLREDEWLLVEWRGTEGGPCGYWLSNLPADAPVLHLVKTAKLRWLVERDSLRLTNDLGFDQFEGRGWRGFHHHAALCIASYGFLLSEQALPPEPVGDFAPSGSSGAVGGSVIRDFGKPF